MAIQPSSYSGSGSIDSYMHTHTQTIARIPSFTVAANTKDFTRPTTLHPKKTCRAPKNGYLSFILKNQFTFALTLIGANLFLYVCHEPSRNHTIKFIRLSYASSNHYGQGIDDIFYILSWVTIFTALRAIAIESMLLPLAKYLNVEAKVRLRFAEQGWMVMYYGVFWTLGMYLWIGSEYWLNNKAIWIRWPEQGMSGLFKFYYLVQLAFWLQQIVVIHTEKRRKDHHQMLSHHIITCSLISATYVYRYVRAANVVLCLMDAVDLLLPIAKMLRYTQHETACNLAFGLFVLTWFFARHVMYLQLMYDIAKDVPGPDTMHYGCYIGGSRQKIEMPVEVGSSRLLWPFQSASNPICLDQQVKWTFLGMLGFLQALSMIWFMMIMRVVVGILRGKGAEDTRSEDEGTDGEDADFNVKDGEVLKGRRQMDVTDLNVCVGGGDICDYDRLGGDGVPVQISTPVSRTRNARRRPGVLEKEILNRIGCEKPV